MAKIISMREIVYHIIRGIPNKLEKVDSVLRAQKGLTLEEVEQILIEKEARLSKKDGDAKHNTNQDGRDEKAYKMTGNHKKKSPSGCFICGKTNHIAKQCYYRQDRSNNHFEGRNQRGKGEWRKRRRITQASGERGDKRQK